MWRADIHILPEPVKYIYTEVQDAWWTSSRVTAKKALYRYFTVKLPEAEGSVKILKGARKKAKC